MNNPPAKRCGNWTPDGRYYVFQSTRNGRTNIWSIRDTAGFFRKSVRDPVQLTSGQMDSSAPVFSRDGNKLFVIGSAPREEIIRYDAKSGQFVPYLAGVSADSLAFSTEGNWVAYVTFPEGTLWRSKATAARDSNLRLLRCRRPCRVGRPTANKSPSLDIHRANLRRFISSLPMAAARSRSCRERRLRVT